MSVTVALTGLPEACPACGWKVTEAPLMVCGNSLTAVCPECWANIAPVKAVLVARPQAPPGTAWLGGTGTVNPGS